ncbi:MAG: signal recognition particle protein [Sphingomonadaceae bacterium]|uniref:signal recognition particle protein n=1 Tax=Thermaurantiacus sp. TaxID=2820283 RepID=UPI00298F0385|nr:signal recognition particle protein [Thermaurantiacus sp.]MCS6986210.1 signal recognition particle protein [Sphingomonadaceae bacterium]MDW8415867.1 signal recognition particle protein [Thermaurantiacus sp.]
MFESLSERLTAVLDRLKGRGALSELEVRAAMREVRVALLEADVALPVVKSFIERATARAVGAEVLKSVTPGQQVIKIVHDELVATLGAETAELAIDRPPPAVVMMVGLQGSGKTTTTAKLARHVAQERRRKVLMASLDTRRPAAQEQLAILGRQAGVATLPVIPGQQPVDIARRALEAARLQGFDVLLLDTAGRLHVDEELMSEMEAVARVAQPAEILLVVDALTGQDAVHVARSFLARVPVTGVVLTRMDGDARGGAALSMREVTGRPIKFVGTGEKLDAFEPFHPNRAAGRILGMGDVVSLVEKAARTLEAQEAERMAARLAAGRFDLNDLLAQFRQMKRMGGLGLLASLLPGLGKAQAQMKAAGIDDRTLARLEAIILAMTPRERERPEILNARRKIRIAKGSGTTVQEVNRLLKMHAEMETAMKRLRKMGGLKALAGLFGGAETGPFPAGLPGGLPGGFRIRR